ncbi:hypothetical protein HJFPF1_10140 [Paramyrothecium foliicola]|nr:hypothetical protein HJFPF1_10140 [Paramyrothecium foliicola]
MEQLLCRSCGRPFLTASARDRHQLRCKSASRSRKKACSACARSKVRCSHTRPACQRCAVLDLRCVYASDAAVDDAGITTPDESQAASYQSSFTCESPPGDLPSTSDELMPTSDGPFPNILSLSDSGTDFHSFTSSSSNIIGSPGSVPNCQSCVDNAVFVPPVSLQGGFENGIQHDSIQTVYSEQADSSSESSGSLEQSWISAEEGLGLMQVSLENYPRYMVDGEDVPPFIHHQHFLPAQRPDALATATSYAHMHLARTPQSEPLLLELVASQIKRIQLQISKNNDFQNLAALQAICLYEYPSRYDPLTELEPQPLASTKEMVTELAPAHNQSMHGLHVPAVRRKARGLGYLAATREHVQVRDKPPYALDLAQPPLTANRSFFILHAIDAISRIQENMLVPLCIAVPDMPLPLPEHIWNAATAEEWSSRYTAWKRLTGEPLQGRHLLSWLRGKRTGQEEALSVWFRSAGPLGNAVFHCIRLQNLEPGIDELL